MRRLLRGTLITLGVLLAVGGASAVTAGLGFVWDPAAPDERTAGVIATGAGLGCAGLGFALLGRVRRRAGRILGRLTALYLIGLSIPAVADGIDVAARAPHGERPAALVLALTGAAILVSGFVLLVVTWASLVRFLVGLAGLLLLPVGYGLFIAAVVVPFNSAERHVTALLAAGSVVCTVLGVALLALGLRWAQSEAARRRWGNGAKVAAMVGGTQFFFSGLLTLVMVLPNILASRDSDDPTVAADLTAITAYGVLFLFLGTILVYHSVSSLMSAPSGPFRPSRWLWLSLALPAALLGGQAVLQMGQGQAAVLPAAYTAAFLLPGLTVLFLFGRVLLRGRTETPGAPTWRDVFVMLAWGALGATTLAGIINSVSVLAPAVLILAATGNLENISNDIDLYHRIDSAPDYLAPWALFLLVLVWIAVLVPLTEEAAKALGVALRIRAYSTPASAFLSGVASGAGFGTMEALLYGLAGLVFGDAELWAVLMLARAGGSTMHALAAGSTTLGLYYAIRERRRLRLLRNYAFAAGLHAVWNGGLIVLGFALFGDALGDESRTGAIVSFTYVGVLSVLAFCGLLIVSRRLRRGLVAGALAPQDTEAAMA